MDHRMPFDRPRETDGAQLWVLAQRLEGQRFRVELSDQTLVVRSPHGSEPTASITVVCRARADDGGRPWFFTPSGMPISETDHIIDAALMIRHLLDRGRS